MFENRLFVGAGQMNLFEGVLTTDFNDALIQQHSQHCVHAVDIEPTGFVHFGQSGDTGLL